MNLSTVQHASLKGIFAKDPQILLVYLFGSRARNQAVQESDFDLGLLTQSPFSLDRQADLNLKVMRALQSDRIDFVFMNEAPILLKYEVVGEGKLIHSTLDQEAVDRYEMSIYREYFHTERFRELQLKQLKETFL